MNEILSLLENIYKYPKKGKSPIINLLNNGINKEYINSHLKKNNLEFPNDVYSLYNWKNGVNDSEEHLMGNITFFPMGIFSSFERAYNNYQICSGKDSYWTKSLFPIFESGGAGFHLLECDPLNKNYGIIYFYDLGAYEFDTIIGKYDSVRTLLESVRECYEEGVYTYNEERLFTVVDYERSFEISKNSNPLCQQYWNLLL